MGLAMDTLAWRSSVHTLGHVIQHLRRCKVIGVEEAILLRLPSNSRPIPAYISCITPVMLSFIYSVASHIVQLGSVLAWTFLSYALWPSCVLATSEQFGNIGRDVRGYNKIQLAHPFSSTLEALDTYKSTIIQTQWLPSARTS